MGVVSGKFNLILLPECQVAVVITGAAVGDPFNDLTILGAEEATQLRNCKPLIVYNPSVDLFPEFLEYAVGNGSNIIISVGFVLKSKNIIISVGFVLISHNFTESFISGSRGERRPSPQPKSTQTQHLRL